MLKAGTVTVIGSRAAPSAKYEGARCGRKPFGNGDDWAEQALFVTLESWLGDGWERRA